MPRVLRKRFWPGFAFIGVDWIRPALGGTARPEVWRFATLTAGGSRPREATARGNPRRGSAESRQALSALNAQVVSESKEGSGETRVGLGLGAINLIVHHADQRHVPVLHNDVNGRERLVAVVDEVGIAVDGPSDSDAQLV